MTDADRPAFAAALYVLTETFNEPVSEVRAEGYFLALRDLSLELVLASIQKALGTCKFFPRPVELREMVLGDPDTRSGAAWEEVTREIQRVGYVGVPTFTDPRVLEAVVALWGSWQRLCRMLPCEGPEPIGWIKQFKSVYLSLEKRVFQAKLAAGVPPNVRAALLDIANAKTLGANAERRFDGPQQLARKRQ